MRPVAAAIGMAAALLASDALSCTQLFLGVDGQRYYQRQARLDADSVFLARARPQPLRRRAVFEPIAAVEGARPPARSFMRAGEQGDCGPAPVPQGVVVAFARRTRLSDDPWRPWNWGRWHVFSSLYSAEIVDGELASALRDAAGRLRRPR